MTDLREEARALAMAVHNYLNGRSTDAWLRLRLEALRAALAQPEESDDCPRCGAPVCSRPDCAEYHKDCAPVEARTVKAQPEEDDIPEMARALLEGLDGEKFYGSRHPRQLFVEAALKKARNQPEEGWVSVEERLPRIGQPVIVDGGVAVYAPPFGDERLGPPVWRTLMEPYVRTDRSDVRVIQWEVTHWRPLPPGPED